MMKAQHFQIIRQAIEYLSEHPQEQPNLDSLAARAHLSKYHFQRLFTDWVGLSPKQFLQLITTERAKSLLSKGHSTLETAYEVGLSGNGRLHDLFIKVLACSPGDFSKRGSGEEIYYDTIDSPFGMVGIAETKYGICEVQFIDQPWTLELLQIQYPQALLRSGLRENGELLRAYFQDWQKPARSIVLDLKGTPFQLQVWQALLSIPSARLASYGTIAQAIGKPRASRAVGTAIGKNPIAYLIPCHRVIRESGQLGGYRWGSDRKTAIIGYEVAKLGS